MSNYTFIAYYCCNSWITGHEQKCNAPVFWTAEIWTVKTGLGLLLGLGFLLRLDLGLGLVLGFELVFTLGLGLGLIMTVQFMTVQIKTGNHGTVSSPHFLTHVYSR